MPITSPAATEPANTSWVSTSAVRRGHRRLTIAKGGPPMTTPIANAVINPPAVATVVRRSAATAGSTPARRNSALPIANRLNASR